MAKVKPWQVSASFWNKVKPVIPSPKLDPNKKYRGQPGGGRKPCQRNVLAVRVLILRWAESGFLVTLWPTGLAEDDEMEAICWKWPSTDGGLVKAPLAPETVGPNPTDRGKRKPAKFVSRRPWSPFVTRRKRGKSA